MPNTLEVPPRDPVAMPAAATIDSLATAAAVREDQVQSAVGFLSHPKVCSLPRCLLTLSAPTTHLSGIAPQQIFPGNALKLDDREESTFLN